MTFDELLDTVKDEEVTLDVDEVQVKLTTTADGGVLAAIYLGELPDETLSTLSREMMRANHLFQDTAGATLSLEPGTRHAFLQRRYWLSEHGEEAFLNHLAILMQKAEDWKARLLGGNADEPFSGESASNELSSEDLLSGRTFLLRV